MLIFFQNSTHGIQYTYSNEFFIGKSITETSLLISSEIVP